MVKSVLVWLCSTRFALQHWPHQQKVAKTQAEDAFVCLAQGAYVYTRIPIHYTVYTYRRPENPGNLLM